jgi:hypothetical protein
MPVGRIENTLNRLPILSRVVSRLDAARAEVAHLQALIETSAPIHMPLGRSTALPPADDLALTRRIIAAYRAAVLTPLDISEPLTRRIIAGCRAFFISPLNFCLLSPLSFLKSAWLNEFAELKRDVHDALMGDDEAAVRALLRDPGRTDLFYGFENLTRSIAPSHVDEEIFPRADKEQTIEGMFELLSRLCEARECRLTHPDGPMVERPPGIDAMFAALDKSFGGRFDFPNPFPGEIGLSTSRGVASYRALQAVYQAGRIVDLLTGGDAPRVLEVGAGLGRTAYYAWQFGIRDYTIIDIPISAVAQANFLGRTVGEQHIQLYGETKAAGIRILPPAAFLNVDDRYDLIINVDSLTEMNPATAYRYVKEIEKRSSVFWSVNHEENSFKVSDLFSPRIANEVVRTPYCMRIGYVEELLDQRPRQARETDEPVEQIADLR